MIRFGVIGYGIMGKLYSRIIAESPRTELICVASKSEGSRNAAKEKYNILVYDRSESLVISFH